MSLTFPRDEEERDERDVTGPKVKRLLKEKLRDGWSLRLAREDGKIEIYEKRRHGLSTWISVRARFATIEEKKPYRALTCEEIAAKVDAWLANYHAEQARQMAALEARRAEVKRNVEKQRALCAELSLNPDERLDVTLAGSLAISLVPSSDGEGWVVFGNAGKATSAEVRALLETLKIDVLKVTKR